MTRIPHTPGMVPSAAADTDRDTVVSRLNSLLRGEISAAETYRMAISKVRESSDVPQQHVMTLQQFLSDHEEAIRSLRDHVVRLGGEPVDGSGIWGAWAKFAQGTANLFGDINALRTLREGEEHGLKEYNEGLEELDAVTRDVVVNKRIPAQEDHIRTLNGLIGALENNR
ncbi:MAG TPA: DUF2383 domain-containing protein [Tepidisphaeraceae bacterium]|nr:DUF2383 domain-containing protein [Tepidisphaeraceae bacterium]